MGKRLIKRESSALASVAQWIEHGPVNQRVTGQRVQFPVRAHAWVAGQVPSGGHMRSNHTLMFLSLSFSFPSPQINRERKLGADAVIGADAVGT